MAELKLLLLRDIVNACRALRDAGARQVAASKQLAARPVRRRRGLVVKAARRPVPRRLLTPAGLQVF